MSEEKRMFAPVTFEMKVWMTNEEGAIAKATCDLPLGSSPTNKDIAEMVKESILQASKQGFRICTPEEFMQNIVYESTGELMAVGGVQEGWEELEKYIATSWQVWVTAEEVGIDSLVFKGSKEETVKIFSEKFEKGEDVWIMSPGGVNVTREIIENEVVKHKEE